VAEVLDIIGDVKGKRAIIVDDIIDTAGTVCAASELLLSKGAIRVDVVATHGLLSGPAMERLRKSPVEEVVITNTIPAEQKNLEKLKVVSIASLIGEAIRRIHEGESVSMLFT
jgi:ribose-phosphate pyrophosphokinase